MSLVQPAEQHEGFPSTLGIIYLYLYRCLLDIHFSLSVYLFEFCYCATLNKEGPWG